MSSKSKLFVAVAVSVILLPVSNFVWAADAPAKAPNEENQATKQKTLNKANIDFEAREFDFGSVEQGEKVTHIFQFKNTGQDNLLIDKIETSCGCTAAITSAKTILPNESGTIESNFNSARFNGHIHKTISVYSNDPDEPVIILTLRGKVVTDVNIVPQSELFFGLVEYKQPASKSFLLTQEGDEPLEIKKVECDLNFATTEVIAGVTGNKKIFQVMVHLSDKAPLGRFEGMVKIYTNLPRHQVIERKVMGVVKESDEAQKKSLSEGGNKDTLLPPNVKPIPESKPAAK